MNYNCLKQGTDALPFKRGFSQLSQFSWAKHLHQAMSPVIPNVLPHVGCLFGCSQVVVLCSLTLAGTQPHPSGGFHRTHGRNFISYLQHTEALIASSCPGLSQAEKGHVQNSTYLNTFMLPEWAQNLIITAHQPIWCCITLHHHLFIYLIIISYY